MNKMYIGKWLIQDMDEWGKDFIDMLEPGHIQIDSDGMGFLKFGAIQSEIDCRAETIGKFARLQFSFSGVDDGSPISGRGWCTVQGDTMEGTIFFHQGDESGFTASR